MSKQDNENYLYDVVDVGVIEVTGEDAESFLQAQLSNDISALDTQHWQRSAYCNPKGRVIAVVEIVRKDDGFWMTTHTSLLPALIKRLSMYVLRAKVLFTAIDAMKSIGVSGKHVIALIQERWPELVTEESGMVWQDDLLISRVGRLHPRLVLTGAADKITEFRQKIKLDYDDGSSDDWKRLGILDGVPTVCAATTEQFIPQALNLDLIDGVSFNKGCYPGQEIVARVHFLGKSNQRMRLAHVLDNTSLLPGDPVYREDREQRAGTVVDAVCKNSGCDVLISINSNDNEKYYTDSSSNGLVEWHDLSYPVVT